MKKTALLVLLVCLATCSSLAPPANLLVAIPVPADAWVIRNGALIDGVSVAPVADAVVVIRGERIWAAGQAAGFLIGRDVRSFDAGGGTILPGLIDAHVHHVSPSITRWLFLQAGVTSVCDTGSSRNLMPFFDGGGEFDIWPAARGFKSGPMIAPHDSYPGVFFGVNLNDEVGGADAARAAVADLAGRGADYIKITLESDEDGKPYLTQFETQAAVDAAHAHGLVARAHVRTEPALRLALESGVDVLEHVPVPDEEPLRDEDRRIILPPEFAALLDRAAGTGVILVPTLHALADETDRPDLLLAAVRHFHLAGGRIALGNDYGTPGVPLGLPLGEMELLLQAGLTPMQVLQAGTRQAAAACGQESELGTIEAGKLADLIVVAGDPLAGLTALNDVRLVVLGGQMIALPSPEVLP